jgi:hypothetical protein
MVYRSRYVTKFAEMAPQKLSTEAETMTAVVELTALMIFPTDNDKMNWARKTILLTIPTSVPIPLTRPASCFCSVVLVLSSSEYCNKKNQYFFNWPAEEKKKTSDYNPIRTWAGV